MVGLLQLQVLPRNVVGFDEFVVSSSNTLFHLCDSVGFQLAPLQQAHQSEEQLLLSKVIKLHDVKAQPKEKRKKKKKKKEKRKKKKEKKNKKIKEKKIKKRKKREIKR